jgi:hypothetical protein
MGPPVDVTFVSVGAEDGNVVETSETSNVGGVVGATASELHVGDHLSDTQVKGFVSFDTSAIPDDALIVAATVRLQRVGVFGTNPFDTLGTLQIDVQTGAFGGNAALAAGDFQAAATVVGAGTLPNATANGAWSSGVLGVAGLAAINIGGTTQMRLAFVLDDNDNGVLDRMRYASGDHTTSASRPQLIVTYQQVVATTSSTTSSSTSTSSTTSTVPSTTSTTVETSTSTTITTTTSTTIETTTSTSLETTTTTSTTTSSSTSTTSTTTSSTTTTTVGTPVQVTFQSIGAEDGNIVESSETSGVGGLSNSTNADLQVGDHTNDAQFRGILSFDTSPIPDGAVIVAVTVRVRRIGVFGTNPFTTLGACSLDVQSGAFGGDAALQAGDFQAAATVAAAGTLSSPALNGDWSTGTLNAAGLGAINGTGRTQVRVAFAIDDNDNLVADRIRYASGDDTTVTSRPEMIVTYLQ